MSDRARQRLDVALYFAPKDPESIAQLAVAALEPIGFLNGGGESDPLDAARTVTDVYANIKRPIMFSRFLLWGFALSGHLSDPDVVGYCPDCAGDLHLLCSGDCRCTCPNHDEQGFGRAHERRFLTLLQQKGLDAPAPVSDELGAPSRPKVWSLKRLFAGTPR